MSNQTIPLASAATPAPIKPIPVHFRQRGASSAPFGRNRRLDGRHRGRCHFKGEKIELDICDHLFTRRTDDIFVYGGVPCRARVDLDRAGFG